MKSHLVLSGPLAAEPFRTDVRWIARTLDLSADQVNVALQQLLRLGMLSMEDGETWVDRTGDSTTVHADEGGLADSGERVAQAAVRHLAERVRRQAFEAAGQGKVLEYSSTTLAVDGARLPEALARIARFRRDLVEFFGGTSDESGSPRRNAVVQLEISLLPLTRTDPDERNNDGTTRDAVAGGDAFA